MAGLLPCRIPRSQSILHPGIGLCAAQSGKGEATKTTWSRRHRHSYLSLAKRLNPLAEESLQNLLAYQSLFQYPSDDLQHGLQLGEVGPGQSMLPVGMGDGQPLVNIGSSTSASSFSKNHAFRHPTGGSCYGMEKNQPQDQSRPKYPHNPGTPLLCPNHVTARLGKGDSTGSREAQSQCRPHTESRRLLYVESPKELGDATIGHRNGEGSGGIYVTANQIPDHRKLRTPRQTPLPEQEI
jgi:hypothetical protein